ncbi:MAG: alpha/beta hydrolase [Pseudomonadota bacterium]
MAEFLESPSGRRIAYSYTKGDGPGVVFLGGFMSDMAGSKATFLEKWAKETRRAFVRFDYSGHGQSDGAFTQGAIGDWTDDALAVVDQLTQGPQILVGSSMGGWISLLVAKARPERIAGFVGIAAAPDFTEDMFNHALSEAQRTEVMEQGQTLLASEYDDPYPITKRLIEEGRNNFVMSAPLSVSGPVRLLVARDDAIVTAETQLALLDHILSEDVRATIVKGGDHSFSSPENLTLIQKTIHSVTEAIAHVPN